MLSQAALDTAKAELREKLELGGATAAETCLEPGLEFVIKVRALTEIGTEEAGRLLERQVSRRISDDPVEQSWYWIDLAQALRELNRSESLPVLLRCSDRALEGPLGHLFASEMASFPQFGDYLLDPLSVPGQSALRVLRTAMEGVRRGYVTVALYGEAQIGEIVRHLAESCPNAADPLLARVFIEALRHSRRSYAASPELRDDPPRRQAVRWQVGYLRDAEPILREYLHDIGNDLCRMLPHCSVKEQADILQLIDELRIDAGDVLVGLLDEPSMANKASALKCLRWSSSMEAACLLWERVRPAGSGQGKNSTWWKRNRIVKSTSSSELLATLEALRGHPSEETESILCQFAGGPQIPLRVAALRSLGWWEPILRADVLNILHLARLDHREQVRSAAIAALARLGECASLQVIRESLTNGNPKAVHEAIELIGSEGLSWLWPDIDLLTESDDPAIAHHAWEVIEGLRESILGPLA